MKKQRIISFTFLFLVFLLGSFNSSSKVTDIDPSTTLSATEYFIEIYSDEDLIQHSFPGDGSKTNPFLISGYNFSNSQLGGIYISNISRFVKIQNCFLKNIEQGIHISKTDPERIAIWNNTFSYCQTGVILNEIEDVDVFHNKFASCGSYSIMINLAHSTTVWNNSFEQSEDYAIFITSGSGENLVFHNDFIDNALKNDEANSQARDDGRENSWSYAVLEDGNYWKDLGEKEIYYIDGMAEATDNNPHSGPVLITREYMGGGIPFSFSSLIIAIISLVSIRIIYKKKNKNSQY